MSAALRSSHAVRWRVAQWTLLVAFLFAGALNMAGARAGFATTHLADLVGPAWLYIIFRGLHAPRRQARLYRMLGATPESAALLLFIASTLTEFSQKYWPTGLFAGVYDPLDIVAYGAGLGVCYLLDRLDR